MTPHERLKIVHFLFAAAWADGELAQEEGDILATLLSTIELEPGELDRVQGWFSAAPPSPDWTSLSQDPETSEAVVRQALVLAGADLTYSLDEIQFLERLRKLAGLDDARFHAMWREVEQLLVQGRRTD